MRFAAGVDVGSTQTKAAIVEQSAGPVAFAIVDTGASVTRAAENAFHVACREASLQASDVGFVVGTGYGR
ncbi:MAG: BadF/BadG/BcrA/BcrD ATPase family protein, partial [Blastocatellia bacterium]